MFGKVYSLERQSRPSTIQLISPTDALQGLHELLNENPTLLDLILLSLIKSCVRLIADEVRLKLTGCKTTSHPLWKGRKRAASVAFIHVLASS